MISIQHLESRISPATFFFSLDTGAFDHGLKATYDIQIEDSRFASEITIEYIRFDTPNQDTAVFQRRAILTSTYLGSDAKELETRIDLAIKDNDLLAEVQQNIPDYLTTTQIIEGDHVSGESIALDEAAIDIAITNDILIDSTPEPMKSIRQFMATEEPVLNRAFTESVTTSYDRAGNPGGVADEGEDWFAPCITFTGIGC